MNPRTNDVKGMGSQIPCNDRSIDTLMKDVPERKLSYGDNKKPKQPQGPRVGGN